MSQRLGMQDGRCFTVYSSANILNDYVMEQAGIPLNFNYQYRQYLQQQGPEVMQKVQSLQKVGNSTKGGFNQCMSCNLALL